MTETAAVRLGSVTLLVVACVVGVTVPAGAQPGDTGWTVSLIAGSLFGGDLKTGERGRTSAAAVGLGLGRGMSLEAEVAAIPEQRQFGDITLLVGTGSLLYHPFTAGRLTPYGQLGASLVRLSAGRADTETEVELAVDVGGGFWLRVAGPLALRTDLRFIHIDNAPNFWRVAAGVTFAP